LRQRVTDLEQSVRRERELSAQERRRADAMALQGRAASGGVAVAAAEIRRRLTT
jgi:hypothetical protein